MRPHGQIDAGGGLGAGAHACRAFHDRQDFVDTSLEYLNDGLRAGQRLAYERLEPFDLQL